MKEYGKKFETDFKESFVNSEAFVYRIKTRITQYKGDSEIADFFAYLNPNLFVLELKSTKEKRLPFDNIRANQIAGLLEASKYDGIYAGVLVQFREPEYSHWYVPIDVIVEYIQADKKSIPFKDFELDKRIIKTCFTKKRVSVTIDVDTLLKDIVREE